MRRHEYEYTPPRAHSCLWFTQIAVVLALLVKSDYPETWTDAFDQLRSVLVVGSNSSSGGAAAAGGGRSAAAARAHVELYLRVLCALDEEVVSFHVDRSREEADHNSLIKVRMSRGAG